MSTTRKVLFFSIKNPDSARRLANALITTPYDSLILPFIDHPEGPVFKEIISKKFRSLTVCERDEGTKELFSSYVKENFQHKNIHIYQEDLIDLSFKKHIREAQDRCSSIVQEILNRNSEEIINKENRDSNIKFLVPLLPSKYESGFLKNLYYQFALRIGLCSSTLVHYYFLMSDRQYMYLDAKPGEKYQLYRPVSVLCNTIFTPQKLDTYDLSECFQISLRKIQKTSKANKSQYQKVHLVWLKPREDVINYLEPEDFLEFRFLVNQVMQQRSRVVLNFLEKWFHDCKKDVAQFGITKDTRSGDLGSQQYYNLYLYLRSRPDYRSSTFLQAVASTDETVGAIV